MADIHHTLEKARKNLLELSTRNRLLSIPQSPRAKLVTVEDERPTEILRLLAHEGKAFSFLPGEVKLGEDAPPDFVALPQPDDDEEVDERGVAARHSDTKLQTRLAPEALQRRLLSIFYDARTTIEEQGVNTLFLALGQLRWRDTNTPDKDRFAPLLLVPVELERRSARTRFRVSMSGGEPSDNLSLTEKLKEFGIRTPDFEWSDEFDYASYVAAYREAIAGQPGWDVLADAITLGFFSFAKFLMFRDLDPATWPEAAKLEDNRLVTSLVGGGFQEPAELHADDVHLDELVSVERLNHVVDADSSQALAIEDVRAGHDLIVQGPPGTGKSQTITNLIATAVLDGKSVLFVAEKLAALDVVKRRLDEIGLGPLAIGLHSHRTNKRNVLAELQKTLELGAPKEQNHERAFARLEKLRTDLNAHAARLNDPREPSDLAAADLIASLTALRTSLDDPKLELDGATTWTAPEAEERASLVAAVAEQLTELGTPADHPWFGVQRAVLTPFDSESIQEQVSAVVNAAPPLDDALADLAAPLAQAPPSMIFTATHIVAAAKHAAEVPPAADRNALRAPGIFPTLPALAELIDAGQSNHDAHASLSQRLVPAAFDTDVTAIRLAIAAHGTSWFRFLNGDYRRATASFKALLTNPASPGPVADRIATLDALTAYQQNRKTIEANTAAAAAAFGTLWQGEHSDWAALRAVHGWLTQADSIGLDEFFLGAVAELPRPADLAEPAKLAGDLLTAQRERLAELFDTLELDVRKAFDAASIDGVEFEPLAERATAWRDHPESLSRWVAYHTNASRARELGLGQLVTATESGALAPAQLPDAFAFAYHKQLYQDLAEADPDIATFDGDTHGRLVQKFRDADNNRIQLARYEAMTAHHGAMPSRHSTAGALGILLGEMKRKRGHMPVRKLLATTGSAVQAIKPVFMMSPLSVAQFLAPGALRFDLVVFDEASQVEPVDALGAIARGSQLVVVGDEKQLPPTRFFANIDTDDDSEDEGGAAGAGDIESVLGLAEAKGLPSRMLRWHYRSRHGSLIAVSNAEFYEDNLYIIPSPDNDNPAVGLKFHHVEGGTFARGASGGFNRTEAQAVARAVIEHATTNPQQTLGVAAFSVRQRDTILDEIERLRREHPAAEPFFQDHPFEPFFVKNLENVQGDERDVIYISVGYAPSDDGSFPMNFGPLNRDGGERRLNVLISRAKFRCEVFSSIVADQIDTGRAPGRGVAALKTFLAYAATGTLPAAGSDGTGKPSAFVTSVRDALQDAGHTVHTRVGTAGFYVDLAVADPDDPGRFLLGIQCDGPSYHAARSARERDRQRDAVLRAHGWTVHRLWCSDWFQRPAEQLEATLAAIEGARTPSSASLSDPDEPTIEREATPEEALEANPVAVPYEEADFRVPDKHAIHELPVPQLAEILFRVLETEAPLHATELAARTRQLWDARNSSKTQDAIDAALVTLIDDDRVKADGSFLLLPDKPVTPRDRSEADNSSLRKPDNLPPAEVAAAVPPLIEAHHGLQVDELPKVVSKTLGFHALTQDLRDAITPVVDTLVAEGTITTDGQFYQLPPEAPPEE